MANQGAPEIQIGDGSLHVGDRVVYPNQGICRITGVETKQIAGQSWEVVTLSREEDGATVMVPRNKVMGIGLRKVANVDAIEEVFDYLAAPTDDPQLDWKVRHRENADKMTGGGLFGTAEVLKGLHALSRVRPLPQKERELYDSARHLIVGEIAAAMGIPLTIAENNLDYALFPPPGMKRKGKELQPAAIPATAGAVRAAGDDDLGFGDEAQEDDGDAASTSAAKVSSGAKARAIDDEDDEDGAEAVEPDEDERPKPAAAKPATGGRSIGNSKPAPAAKAPAPSKPTLTAAPSAPAPAAPEKTPLPAPPSRFAQPAASAHRTSHPAEAAESVAARAAPRPAKIASPSPVKIASPKPAAKPSVAKSAPAPAARKAPAKPASRPAAKATPKKAAPSAKKAPPSAKKANRSAKPAPRKSAPATRKPAAKSKGKR
jgi:RNA polymerase-interacting CarD/CdnL/TRCF family regulator